MQPSNPSSGSGNLSILSNFDRAEIYEQPYPYIVIRDALAPDLYATLEATFPGPEVITNGREMKDTWYDYPACKVTRDERCTPLWRAFFSYHVSDDFYQELAAKLGDTIRRLHPDLDAKVGKPLEEFAVGMRPGGRGDPLAPNADISMECQFYLNFTRQPRIVRGPHVDRPTELFAALLYFRQEGDDSLGSDLNINAANTAELFPADKRVRIDNLPMEIDPAKVSIANTVHYAPNSLVLFLNSERSIHSVTPRSATPIARRHVNFCGDLTVDLFSVDLPARLALKQKLQEAPVAWRLAKYL